MGILYDEIMSINGKKICDQKARESIKNNIDSSLCLLPCIYPSECDFTEVPLTLDTSDPESTDITYTYDFWLPNGQYYIFKAVININGADKEFVFKGLIPSNSTTGSFSVSLSNTTDLCLRFTNTNFGAITNTIYAYILDYDTYDTTFCEIKSMFMKYCEISNKINGNLLENMCIDWNSHVKNKPMALQTVLDTPGTDKHYMLLDIYDYVKLFDNKFVLDRNRINEVSNSSDTYTANTIDSYNNIIVNSTSSQDGSGQFIEEPNDYETYCVFARGSDVNIEYISKKSLERGGEWNSTVLSYSTGNFCLFEYDSGGGGIYFRFKKSSTGTSKLQDIYVIKKSDMLSKKYVDTQLNNITNRTEILPIKNTHCVIQNGVPASQQNINMNGIDINVYTFNDEQITVPNDLVLENVKDKFSAIKSQSRGLLNAVISYNDGTNDITKEVELIGNDYTSNFEYAEYSDTSSFIIEFGFNFDINKFYIYVGYMTNGMDSSVFYAIKNVTISYNYYTNLIRDNYIQDIDYSKINNIPSQLNYLADGMTKTLSIGEYANLFDNLFVWDANKINDKLDSTSGVKQNVYYNHNIQIKQKDSEGIGFGQYIPSSTMNEYSLFIKAGQDVIIKVYQHETKKLLNEIKDFSIGKYKEIKVMDGLNNSDGIFIAFTVKDDVTNFYSNTYVSDLVLCKSDGFLTKQEVDDKVDKSQLSFNSNGELVVTIDGISKTFVPKT